MSEMAACLLEKNGFTKDDLKLLVPHQANLRIIRATQERLGVDDSKVMVNIDRFGNTTAGRFRWAARCRGSRAACTRATLC